MKLKIGVILPTRGLVFTEVIQALFDNLPGYQYSLYTSWDLTIPECENVLAQKALESGCTHLLFIEEDTVIPTHGLGKMIALNADIVCIDYGVAGYSCITRERHTDEILWCGLGCTLIKREVFESLEKPYFRSDKQLLLNYWPETRWIDAPHDAYGGQDIYFCIKARENGFKIQQLPGECRHLRLENLGRPEVNKGLHVVKQKDTISKYQTL